MKYSINTPEGTRDRLFAECRERRGVQSALTGLFRGRGYAEVITPEVEFYDLFLRSGNPMPQEAMLKIIDRSGKIMVMRPDCTTPIARVAATKLKALPLPQRLYYDQTVFRSGQAHRGGSSEIAQCGVELIGAAGLKADLEMVAMAVDALRACALKGFHIELGHAGFFRALAAQMDLDSEKTEEMRSLIEGKNFAALNDFLEPFRDRPTWAAMQRLTRLFGGAEVLDEAEQLAGAGYGQYIRFDLGMVHQIDYYTGVVFRGYVEGAGDAVLSGGRYDGLTASFGRPAPATGFAVDVDAVTSCQPQEEGKGADTLIHFDPAQLAQALQTVDGKENGKCELSPCETLEETIQLAQSRKIAQVLVLEGGKSRLLDVEGEV